MLTVQNQLDTREGTVHNQPGLFLISFFINIMEPKSPTDRMYKRHKSALHSVKPLKYDPIKVSTVDWAIVRCSFEFGGMTIQNDPLLNRGVAFVGYLSHLGGEPPTSTFGLC